LWRSLTETGEVVTKRASSVCIGIDNAAEELANPIRAHIEANLEKLKIERGKPGCTVNALIVFSENAHGFVNWLARKDGGIAFEALYVPERRRLIGPVRPTYNWHVQGASTNILEQENQLGSTTPAAGNQTQAAGFDPGGRIISGNRPAETAMTFSVVDSRAINGLTIEQLGDYLTMHILVEFKPEVAGTAPPGSILNLFTDDGAHPEAAVAMSDLDRTMLEQIYGQRQNFRAGAIRASIARETVAKQPTTQQDASEVTPP
jgi:hypothetical protein